MTTTTEAVGSSAARPQPVHYCIRDDVPNNNTVLEELRNKEKSRLGFVKSGRLLVGFGTFVTAVGGVAAATLAAAGLVSFFATPIGWGVAAAVGSCALVAVLVGVGIVAYNSHQRGSDILQGIKQGLVGILNVVTFGLGGKLAGVGSLDFKGNNWKLDQPEPQGETISGSDEYALGVFFNEWHSRGSRTREFTCEGDGASLTYTIQTTDEGIEERHAIPVPLTLDKPKVGSGQGDKDHVLPLVRKGRYADACAVLLNLYNYEGASPTERKAYAIEIAALMLRIKMKFGSRTFFNEQKSAVRSILQYEMSQEKEGNRDLRLAVAYEVLA